MSSTFYQEVKKLLGGIHPHLQLPGYGLGAKSWPRGRRHA